MMKTFLVLHLILLWALNAASPILTPNGPVYIMNGGSLALTCEIDQDAAVVKLIRNGYTNLLITNTSACSFRKSNSLDTYDYNVTCGQQRKFTMVKHKVNSSDYNTTWSCQIYSLNSTDLGTSLVVKVLMHVPVGSVTLMNGSTLTLIENQSAVLVCETNACRPSAAIYWMKDGENITDYPTNVTAVSVDSDLFVSIGTLTYTGQRGDNMKILTCGAYNGLDSVQTSVNLTVTIYYPPSIQGLASPYKVIENQPLNVTCVVSSNPPADQIFWSPSGEGPVSSTLYFRSVSRTKSGTYNCTAQNTMIPTVGTQRNGTITSHIQVDVLYGAGIVNLSVQEGNTVNENSSAIFQCHVDSNPPSTITWMKENSSTVLKTESGVVQSQYRIESAECLNMGNYTCSAYNGYLTTAKERLELFVRCHPRTDFRLTLQTKIYRKHHEAAILRYTVISYPPPRFNWTFLGNGNVSRGLPVSASQHDNGQQSELRLTSLGIDDFGNYTVIADNSLSPPAREVFEIIPADTTITFMDFITPSTIIPTDNIGSSSVLPTSVYVVASGTLTSTDNISFGNAVTSSSIMLTVSNSVSVTSMDVVTHGTITPTYNTDYSNVSVTLLFIGTPISTHQFTTQILSLSHQTQWWCTCGWCIGLVVASGGLFILSVVVGIIIFCKKWKDIENNKCSQISTISIAVVVVIIIVVTGVLADKTECGLEFGLGLVPAFGILCLFIVVAVIFKRKGYKDAYTLGLVLGQGLSIIFIVCCVIIAILISTDAISGIPMSSPFVFGATGIATTATIIGIIVGLVVTGVSGTTSCKLEFGLGLVLGSGIPCLIAFIIAVIFIFDSVPSFKGNPERVQLGIGILRGLIFTPVIYIIVERLLYYKRKQESTYYKRKRESTCDKPEEAPLYPPGREPDNKPQEPADSIIKQEPTCREPDNKPQEPADKEVCVELTDNNSGTGKPVEGSEYADEK